MHIFTHGSIDRYGSWACWKNFGETSDSWLRLRSQTPRRLPVRLGLRHPDDAVPVVQDAAGVPAHHLHARRFWQVKRLFQTAAKVVDGDGPVVREQEVRSDIARRQVRCAEPALLMDAFIRYTYVYTYVYLCNTHGIYIYIYMYIHIYAWKHAQHPLPHATLLCVMRSAHGQGHAALRHRSQHHGLVVVAHHTIQTEAATVSGQQLIVFVHVDNASVQAKADLPGHHVWHGQPRPWHQRHSVAAAERRQRPPQRRGRQASPQPSGAAQAARDQGICGLRASPASQAQRQNLLHTVKRVRNL